VENLTERKTDAAERFGNSGKNQGKLVESDSWQFADAVV
jgi:hypothetical protein